MNLTLNVVRCPDAVPPETKRITGGEFRLGRGLDNDWVLADPEKILSKRHCVIGFRQGAWALADTSTNGTFLNRETEPVGQGQMRVLEDGDRIRIGSYEIEVRLEYAAAGLGSTAPGGFGATPARNSPFDDPFGDDPFAPSQPAARPFGDDPLFGEPAAPPRVSMPERFDPLAREEDSFGAAPSTPDHTPSFSDAFQPPSATPAPPTAPATTPGLLPDDWDLDLSLSQQGPSPSMPEPVPVPVSPPQVPPIATPADQSAGLLAAFLDGAGMPDAVPAEPVAAFRALGAAFRAMVSGIRQALIARASIKGEFRIEQTMIRSRGNNPLKFSAGDEDALAAMLGVGRRTDMAADEAVADALEDMRLHELASMAAMQAAVRVLLGEFDPAKLRAEAETGGGISLLPAQKKARAFEAFEKQHGEITRALSDDFDRAFGRAFARAYETALADIKARERR